MGKTHKNNGHRSTIKIDCTELLINSAEKWGRHDAVVKSGTGAHKNKKSYCRKHERKTYETE